MFSRKLIRMILNKLIRNIPDCVQITCWMLVQPIGEGDSGHHSLSTSQRSTAGIHSPCGVDPDPDPDFFACSGKKGPNPNLIDNTCFSN